MTLNYRIIGKRIKEARKRKKLTQAELAEIVDKCNSYISYIETAKKQLSLETLVDIANALEVSADELLVSNLQFKHEVKDEFSAILEDCSTYEKKVITDTAKALKQALKDDRKLRSFYR